MDGGGGAVQVWAPRPSVLVIRPQRAQRAQRAPGARRPARRWQRHVFEKIRKDLRQYSQIKKHATLYTVTGVYLDNNIENVENDYIKIGTPIENDTLLTADMRVFISNDDSIAENTLIGGPV